MSTTSHFLGMPTGAIDSDGEELCCGDRVECFEHYPEWLEQYRMEDGRGNWFCVGEPRVHPAKNEISRGVIVYSDQFLRFDVRFDPYSQKSCEPLHVLLTRNDPGDGRYQRIRKIKP